MRALASALLLLLACAASAEPRSGFEYQPADLQRLQRDEFANPGMAWVERGEELFARDCTSCHRPEAMRGVRARYPAWDAPSGRPVGIEERIDLCRARNAKVAPYGWESAELLALSSYVGRQSLGMTASLPADPRLAPWIARGEAYFRTRRGQHDLACTHCHEDQAGRRLRGDVISEGHVNGFPIYRQLWQTMGSSHRMIAWCNEAVRAEVYPAGSQEYVDLELYAKWRGRGLPVETPAVRR